VKRPALLRRRELWVPTVWGWLLLLVLAGAASYLVARNLHGFLATSEPVGARVLVVEGWMGPEELEEAVRAFRSRGYERVVTTGGPIHRWTSEPGAATFADQAAEYLVQKGIPAAVVARAPAPIAPQDRTYQAALALREWAQRSGTRLEAIDVVSEATHARRSRLLYRLALGPEVKVGVLATRAYDYDADAWWRSSVGTKNVIEETIGLIWFSCCFRPRPGAPTAQSGGSRIPAAHSGRA
jgi:uncharacterized SAM-binding protein YcdF (DUF218 family)